MRFPPLPRMLEPHWTATKYTRAHWRYIFIARERRKSSFELAPKQAHKAQGRPLSKPLEPNSSYPAARVRSSTPGRADLPEDVELAALVVQGLGFRVEGAEN